MTVFLPDWKSLLEKLAITHKVEPIPFFEQVDLYLALQNEISRGYVTLI